MSGMIYKMRCVSEFTLQFCFLFLALVGDLISRISFMVLQSKMEVHNECQPLSQFFIVSFVKRPES